MAYIVYCQVRYCWVPDGSAGRLGQSQGDFPGYGAFTPSVGTSRRRRRRPISRRRGCRAATRRPTPNFQTALNDVAAYLTPTRSTAGSVPGFTAGKLTDLMRAWATGGP